MPGWGTRGEWPVHYFSTSSGAFLSTDSWPAPDTDPYSPTTKSNIRLITTFDGQLRGVFPPTKYRQDPLLLTWTRMSGSWFKERLEDYVQSGTGLRIVPHTGPMLSGVILEVRPRARPGYMDNAPHTNRQTLWDIQVNFQPMNVQSGT